VVIMPVSPPFYQNPADIDALVAGFTDKVLALLGHGDGGGWRTGELG
jgi:3-polyprenyl-4-hydroxybenzoate decarboxylase